MSSSAPTEFEVVFTSGPKTGSEGTLAIGQDAVPSAQGGAAFPSTVTHLEIPSLATSADGTGTIMQWGGSEKSWVLASGGTYNTVASIDNIIAAINAPYAMSWAANNEYTYSTSQPLAIWDTLNFGNSANMATGIWTCPIAGLWHIAATFGFSINTNDVPCSFRLYHNGAEVWYFTAWYNISSAGEGITTQCESIFLNLAAGDTLQWYLFVSGGFTMTIGGGNQNSGNTTFNAIRIGPGYTAA